MEIPNDFNLFRSQTPLFCQSLDCSVADELKNLPKTTSLEAWWSSRRRGESTQQGKLSPQSFVAIREFTVQTLRLQKVPDHES